MPDDDEDTGISKMDVIQLCRLLNSDDLCVDSEESVYSCINYWLQSCNGSEEVRANTRIIIG